MPDIIIVKARQRRGQQEIGTLFYVRFPAKRKLYGEPCGHRGEEHFRSLSSTVPILL